MDGPVVVQEDGRMARPNVGAKCGKAERCHFGMGHANRVSRGVVAVAVPRTSRATEVKRYVYLM